MNRTKSVADFHQLLSELREDAAKTYDSVNEKIEKGKKKVDDLNKKIEELSVN